MEDRYLTNKELKSYCFEYIDKLLQIQKIKVKGLDLIKKENEDRDVELKLIDESMKLINRLKMEEQK